MNYEEKKYNNLLGISGFSDKLLNTHFKLYSGYVANVNKFDELASSVETGSLEYAELKRRFGWEWNGMRLHELYFENLSKEGGKIDEASEIYKKISERFSSYEFWEKDFKATAAMRGIGWTLLAYDKKEGKLFNIWINEHDIGHLAGAVPLLVMDVFEHAFIMDYDMNRKDYIDAFFKVINWHEVDVRLQK